MCVRVRLRARLPSGLTLLSLLINTDPRAFALLCVRVAAAQVELHPYLTQEFLVRFCKQVCTCGCVCVVVCDDSF